MNIAVKILGIGFLCLLSSSVTWAQIDQKTQDRTVLYASLFGGYAWPGNIGVNPQSGQSDRDVDPGLIYGLKLGFTPSSARTWVGWEIESYHSSHEVQPLAAGYAKATLAVTTVAFNFILRYPGTWAQPYAGIGPSINRAQSYAFGGSDTSVGMNLLTGVRFPIAERLLAFTEFKYNRVNFGFSDGQYLSPQEFRLRALVAGVSLTF